MGLRRHLIIGISAMVGALATAGSASAAVIAYTNTGAIAGTNATNLNIGRQFAVTGTGITVRDLGVFDNGSNGLVNAHDVTLFTINSGENAANSNVTPITGATLTVPAGTAGALESGFRFGTLASPVFLAPGNYALVAYGMEAASGDPFGNGGGFPANGNVSDIRFDPFSFTGATSPNYPTGGDSNNHSSTSFRYDLGNTTPEPGSLGAMGLGLIALTARRRKSGVA